MSHHAKKRRPAKTPGLPPGTLQLPPDAPPPKIHVFGYGPDECAELDMVEPAELGGLRGRWPVLWINFNGLGSGATLASLERVFGVHHLVLEDIANPSQRPKVEIYADHVYVVLRMQHWDGEGQQATGEQLNLVFGKDFVITVQEFEGDPFDPVRQRLRDSRPLIRNAGADFLAYALIDAVVDHYFPLLEHFGDILAELEERILERPTQATLVRVKRARRLLLGMRRAIWPMRDAIATLQGDHVPFIQPGTRPYLRDVFDHSLRILDVTESFRDQVGGLMDGYMSSVSFRMNEIMGILTLVGTIFLPLSFLTGLYGMNFDTSSPWNLPELGWRFGYPGLLLLMSLISIGLLLAFKRSGWFEFSGSSRTLAAKDDGV
jgi:magnesium transporter